MVATHTLPAPDPAHEQVVLLDVRSIIDQAKRAARVIDTARISVVLDIENPDIVINVPRKTVRDAPAKISFVQPDPSNITVASDPRMVALLVGRLHTLRSEQKAFKAEEDAIKDILSALIGELDYMGLSETDTPLFSMKRESSTRINSVMVKELLPEGEHPDLYSSSTSRPLRLI